MPTVITTTVYTYAELGAKAQEKARDWYRRSEDESGDHYYAEHVIEEAAEIILPAIGVTVKTHPVKLRGGTTRQDPSIWWSGFSSQGDGACFEGSYSYQKGSIAKLHAQVIDPVLDGIARDLMVVQRKYGYQLTAVITHRGTYSHAFSTEIEVEYTGKGTRDVTAADVYAVRDALRGLMNWIYRQLEASYDDSRSDAVVAENIEANEYTFTIDGKREG